jgi:maltooligosyltrehalose trehalohydrolase
MYDARPTHVLAEIKQAADAAGAGRRVHVVGESLLNDVRMVRPPDRGGHGLDAEWDEDFHHAVHALLTGDRHGKYVDFGRAADLPHVLERTFLLDGRYSRYRRRRWGAPVGDLPGDRFVVGVQNHDHVGNRARGERLAALVPPPVRRLAASLLLLAPYLPLLFMGEEYGEEKPFLFFCSFLDGRLVDNVRAGRRRDYRLEGEVPDPQAEATFAASKLNWSWPTGSGRDGLRRLYQDLLGARRRWPALRDFARRTARLLPDTERAAVLELVRGGEPDGTLYAHFNLTDRPQTLEGVPGVGQPRLFTSEAARYGGARPEREAAEHLWPHECAAFGPAAWAPSPDLPSGTGS